MSLRLSESSDTFSWKRSWKYSITCSNICSFAPRATKPICFIAPTILRVSRVSAPWISSTMPARTLPGISATAPKSRNTIGRRRALDRRRADEQVPGVRIGVIDAVDEDLLAVDLDDLARELRRGRARAASCRACR